MEQRTPFGNEAVAAAVPHISKYKYDFSGRLIEETYPSGRVVKNSFETDDDLLKVESRKTVSDAFRTYVSNFSYTASGGIAQMRLGNGRWETAKFNNRQQVIELGLGASAADTSLWKVAYGYGELDANGNVDANKNVGNIAKQTISFNGLAQSFVQTFKYDSLYRITEAKETSGTNTNWQQNWSYDRYGNRIGFAQNIGGVTSNLTPSVDADKNRFTSGQGFVYDKNGNITADVDYTQARSFTFDGDNKQTEIKKNGNVIGKYFYDGEGKRVKKVTNEETTVFVYSGGKLVAEYSTQLSQTPSINYTTTDHLGSPRIITNELGQTKARRDFMPFGEDLVPDASNRTAALKYNTDEVRQKFTGYEKDTETGLDFAEARYYNNAHGRFTAVDPLLASGKSDDPQTFNRYVYVGNNPTIETDPTGTCKAGQCPTTYSGTVYTKSSLNGGDVRYNNEKPDETWTALKSGTDTTVRDQTTGLVYRVFNYGEDSFQGSGWNLVRPEVVGDSNMLPRKFSSFNYLGESHEFPEQKTWGGKITITSDGETDIEKFLDREDLPKATSLAFTGLSLFGGLPGGSGSPPSITPMNRQPIFESPNFEGPQLLPYDPRVRVRAVQDPKSHNFPFGFDNIILSTTPTVKPGGYRIYQFPGYLNTKKGFYEIGVTTDFIIDHRFFRKVKN